MYVVECKSFVSGRESICKKDGEIITFRTKEEADEYAAKRRDEMGINYHYWTAVLPKCYDFSYHWRKERLDKIYTRIEDVMDGVDCVLDSARKNAEPPVVEALDNALKALKEALNYVDKAAI